MNTPAHWLSVWTAITCITMGLASPLGIGPRFLPPSWSALFAVVPGSDLVYPGLFTIAGVVAVIGIRSPLALRIGCLMNCLLFLTWGLVGLYLTLEGLAGGNVQGSFANLRQAGLDLVLAYYVGVGTRGDATDKVVAKLAEKVREADGT